MKRDLACLLIVGLALVLPLAANADFPRDPLKTLQKVQGGRIRVGVVENGPWAVKQGNDARGVEADLVRQLARELGATPEWHWGGEQGHMEALERHELDLVIGGLTKKTPWKKNVGLTDNYFENHVMAAAPGENAWIKRLDEFLFAHKSEVPALLKAEQAQ